MIKLLTCPGSLASARPQPGETSETAAENCDLEETTTPVAGVPSLLDLPTVPMRSYSIQNRSKESLRATVARYTQRIVQLRIVYVHIACASSTNHNSYIEYISKIIPPKRSLPPSFMLTNPTGLVFSSLSATRATWSLPPWTKATARHRLPNPWH